MIQALQGVPTVGTLHDRFTFTSASSGKGWGVQFPILDSETWMTGHRAQSLRVCAIGCRGDDRQHKLPDRIQKPRQILQLGGKIMERIGELETVP
jgi:hypothetical protein